MCQVGHFLMISLLTELTTESQGKQYISIISLQFYNSFIWLRWVFVVGFPYLWRGATPCRGTWAPHCSGFSCCGALAPESSRAAGCMGPVVAAHRLSCSEACGVFLDQGPVFPTLRGGFLSTASSRKSQSCVLKTRLCSPEKV